MMWYDIKEELPKDGTWVEIETKHSSSMYAKFEESDMSLCFILLVTHTAISLDRVIRWRYEPMVGWI